MALDRVLPEDLAAIRTARLHAELAARSAEVVHLRAFVRYGLTEHDSFDVETGVITRHAPAASPEPGDG